MSSKEPGQELRFWSTVEYFLTRRIHAVLNDSASKAKPLLERSRFCGATSPERDVYGPATLAWDGKGLEISALASVPAEETSPSLMDPWLHLPGFPSHLPCLVAPRQVASFLPLQDDLSNVLAKVSPASSSDDLSCCFCRKLCRLLLWSCFLTQHNRCRRQHRRISPERH